MRQLLYYSFLCLLALPAAAKEWQVTAGNSIARAIKSAAAGDTVKVERGYYHEHIIINKPLKLIGVDRPTISGDNLPGDVIHIRATDVQVEGFIVRDSGADLTAQNAGIYIFPGSDRALIRNNDLIYTLFGLWIEKSKDVQIINNLITGKRDLQY